MSICYPMVIPAAAVGYTGPGDIVAGATNWFGMRAYSAAKAATAPYAAIRITDVASGNATDINILTTGSLDMATLNAWIVAHGTAYIFRFYDQVGSIVLESAMGVNQLVVSPSGLTSGRAALRMATNDLFADFVNTITAVQPFTVSWAANNSGASADEGWMFFSNSLAFIVMYNGSGGGAGGAPNVVGLYAGTRTATVAATDGAWHAIQGVYNNTSSGINVDGSASGALTAGTGAPTADVLSLMSGSQDWRGDFVEAGIWSNKAFSNTEASNMSANQHAYWGF